jgi:hypothetical protein
MLRKLSKGRGWALALLGLAAMALATSCSVSPNAASGTGRLNLLVTDSPSDDWQEFTVTLTAVKLHNLVTRQWTDNLLVVDPNDPNSGKLNLVDLSGVATILSHSTIPAGDYDRLMITINTDPTTMTLIDDDGTTIAPADIIIADASGKGEIKVDLAPPIMVDANGVATLQVDFDLAHPMSIILQNGKVVVNLQVRRKAVPPNPLALQFARTLGTVASADTATNSFVVTTDSGSAITFVVDAATSYINVDMNAAGDFAGLTAGVGVLVASNMWADGTLYAREVWYGTMEDLPQFTPEGLVRRVGFNWIKIVRKNAAKTSSNRYNCRWDPDVIYVNAATEWTFQGTVPLGTGTSVLRDIRRGFRVTVTLVDANGYSRVAKSIDVQSAHDEGVVRSVNTTGITFNGDDYGRFWYTAGYCSHQWAYSSVPDHLFKWWFYGQAAPVVTADTAAQTIQDFVDTVTEAKNAGLRVFARVELYWDATLGQWVAENVILAPEKLPDPVHITVGYTTASGAIVVGTFDWDNPTMATMLTVDLDSTSDLQTIVGSLLWNSTTRILTFKAPVLPADWEAYLTPALLGVRVWVRPVKNPADSTFSWTAYAVLGFQVITN